MDWLAWAGFAALVILLLTAINAAVDPPLLARCVVCGVAAVAVRLTLVGLGYVSGTTRVRLLDLTVASIFLIAAVAARRYLGSTATAEQRVSILAGALALPVAAFALLQLVVPTTPPQAGGAACAGAPVAGSDYQAKTGQYGLNARTGPGTTFEPAGRFDAGCIVGIDGYCVGEGVVDISVPLPDVRWFRIRHSESYVSAGTLFALSPASTLGDAPEADCPLGLPDPSLQAAVGIAANGDGTLGLSAVPNNTNLVGFGLYYEGTGGQSELIDQLGIAPKLTNSSGVVTATMSLAGVQATAPTTQFVTLAVVPCLAATVPSHADAQLFHIELATGAVAPLDAGSRDEQLPRLRQAACRTDPSADAATVTQGAVSQP